MEIKILGIRDADALGAIGPDVFDHAIDPDATSEFLNDSRHHLVVAIDGGVVVGFASALHYIHPDKPSPELWINELGVASTHRRCGVGKALLRSLFRLGRQLGCLEAWVLTERGNDAAVGLYRSSGGIEATTEQVMFTFCLDDSNRT